MVLPLRGFPFLSTHKSRSVAVDAAGERDVVSG
jgi:hypothetical protein